MFWDFYFYLDIYLNKSILLIKDKWFIQLKYIKNSFKRYMINLCNQDKRKNIICSQDGLIIYCIDLFRNKMLLKLQKDLFLKLKDNLKYSNHNMII